MSYIFSSIDMNFKCAMPWIFQLFIILPDLYIEWHLSNIQYPQDLKTTHNSIQPLFFCVNVSILACFVFLFNHVKVDWEYAHL